jgi:hypothetical protein
MAREATDDATVDEPAADDREQRMRDRIELVATALLAVATVLTAWSAFQSTKWSGSQANHYARAGALRTASAKASSVANAQQIVDVDTFVSWASALSQERERDPNASTAPDGSYQPEPHALSGFLYERFRNEFRVAVDAWLTQRPLDNPDAAPTPFTLPEYKLAERSRSDRFDRRANAQASLARRDNQRGDNYVLATVLFASVLFFAGVSGKLGRNRNRALTIGLAVVVLLAGILLLATFPVQV